MKTIENSKRHYFTKEAKLKILGDLRTNNMTISTLARKYGIHPMTIYKANYGRK
jgi:transposase-like protein